MDVRYGGSVKVTTDGSNHIVTLAEYAGSFQGSSPQGKAAVEGGFPTRENWVESEEVTVNADTNNSGGATLEVGPNGSAHTRLYPNQGESYFRADPSLVAWNDHGTSGLILYIKWGGPTDRWVASRLAKQAATRR